MVSELIGNYCRLQASLYSPDILPDTPSDSSSEQCLSSPTYMLNSPPDHLAMAATTTGMYPDDPALYQGRLHVAVRVTVDTCDSRNSASGEHSVPWQLRQDQHPRSEWCRLRPASRDDQICSGQVPPLERDQGNMVILAGDDQPLS